MTNETRALNEKGVDAMQSQNWEVASRIFCQSLAQQENQAEAHYMLGQCYRFTERYQLAIEELMRATELGSGLIARTIRLQQVRRRTGRFLGVGRTSWRPYANP